MPLYREIIMSNSFGQVGDELKSFKKNSGDFRHYISGTFMNP